MELFPEFDDLDLDDDEEREDDIILVSVKRKVPDANVELRLQGTEAGGVFSIIRVLDEYTGDLEESYSAQVLFTEDANALETAELLLDTVKALMQDGHTAEVVRYLQTKVGKVIDDVTGTAMMLHTQCAIT